MEATEPRRTLTIDDHIMAMWRDGNDTKQIAVRLQIREHVIANRLAKMRDTHHG